MTEPEELRPYEWGTDGRTDKAGNVWYACDPYPTWYRWEAKPNGDKHLITTNLYNIWFTHEPDRDSETFPGWDD